MTETSMQVIASTKCAKKGNITYKFEKKEKDGEWEISDTKNTNKRSLEYVYEGLTANKMYEIKITAEDSSGAALEKEEKVNFYHAIETAVAHPTTFTGIHPTTYTWESIGQKVEYTPEEGTTSIPANYVGYEQKQDFQTNKDLEWYIWGKDSRYLYIITDGYANFLYLAGYGAYNNSVYYLDEICNKCYSNSSIRAVARNLKIEDKDEISIKYTR